MNRCFISHVSSFFLSATYGNKVRPLESNIDIQSIETFFTSVSRGIGGFITTNNNYNSAANTKLYLYDLEEDEEEEEEEEEEEDSDEE